MRTGLWLVSRPVGTAVYCNATWSSEAVEERTVELKVCMDLLRVVARNFPLGPSQHECHRPVNVLVVDREVRGMLYMHPEDAPDRSTWPVQERHKLACVCIVGGLIGGEDRATNCIHSRYLIGMPACLVTIINPNDLSSGPRRNQQPSWQAPLCSLRFGSSRAVVHSCCLPQR